MQDLQGLLERSVTQLGYELVDLEISNRGKLLRVFIDKPEGVTIDDCVLVSNQLGNVLAVAGAVDVDADGEHRETIEDGHRDSGIAEVPTPVTESDI